MSRIDQHGPAAAAVAVGILASMAAPARAMPGVSHVARIGERGTWVEPVAGVAPEPGAGGAQPVGAGIIWHIFDPGTITESVAVADTTDESWVGHNLNFERLSYLQTTGNGVPIYEVDLVAENPDIVAVSSAEDASLGVLLTTSAAPVLVRGFDTARGAAPIWAYEFAEEYTSAGIRGADVSADGSIVAAVAYTGAGSSLVAVLDGADGTELVCQAYPAFITALELSDDGSRAVLTQGNVARIVETAGLTDLHSFNASGSGGYHRISRDGSTVAAGGFNLRVDREEGGVWTPALTFSQANNWFGAGLALSGNGDTLFVGTYNYATGYLHLTYRVIDLVNQEIAAQISTVGSGVLQDTVAGAQASADGERLAVASWGTANNVHPEVQVFDRDLVLVASIDTPGSPFSIDMTRDGRYVVTGGKAVHANDFGSGSNTYALGVPAACPWDCGDANGAVEVVDLLALLGQWGIGGSCDFDGGGVAVTDLLKLLGAWGGCP